MGICTTGVGGGAGGALLPAAKYAAMPPAATAIPSTTRRAAFITLHFPRDGLAERWPSTWISAAKRQGMVNEAYPKRVNVLLMRVWIGPAGGEFSDAKRRAPSSIPSADRSGAPPRRARCHKARRRPHDAAAPPILCQSGCAATA